MDTSELKEILSRGEDSKTRFKTRFTHVDGLASEICAMANTDGGIIVVGRSSGRSCGECPCSQGLLYKQQHQSFYL